MWREQERRVVWRKRGSRVASNVIMAVKIQCAWCSFVSGCVHLCMSDMCVCAVRACLKQAGLPTGGRPLDPGEFSCTHVFTKALWCTDVQSSSCNLYVKELTFAMRYCASVSRGL